MSSHHDFPWVGQQRRMKWSIKESRHCSLHQSNINVPKEQRIKVAHDWITPRRASYLLTRVHDNHWLVLIETKNWALIWNHRWRLLTLCFDGSGDSKSETIEAPVSAAKPGPKAHRDGIQNGAWRREAPASIPIVAPNLTPKTGSETDPVPGESGPTFGSKVNRNRHHKISNKFKLGSRSSSSIGCCKPNETVYAIAMVTGTQHSLISNKKWLEILKAKITQTRCARDT